MNNTGIQRFAATARSLNNECDMKIRIAALAAFFTLGGMALAQTPPMHLPGDAGQSNGSFHRRFDEAEKWAKVFDDPARDEWQKPDEVVDALGLKPDAIVADLGAGTGYFAVRIARRVAQGKVYAADAEADMVRYLGERADREHLGNIVPVLAGADAANLPVPADLILVVDTYHHIGDRTQYFTRLQASLRPGGRLVIVDFKPDSPAGPPPQHRIPAEKVEEELAAAGYTLAEARPFLPRQYFLVFQKRGS
jgi:ubiquinone/menaquinone biosynthesis C-methylase UbiE